HGTVELDWHGATVAIRCPICGRIDDQTQLCRADVPWQAAPLVVARCGACRAIVFSDLIPLDVAYTDEHYDWDWYVEQTAGIEAIADLLPKGGRPAGSQIRARGWGCGRGRRCSTSDAATASASTSENGCGAGAASDSTHHRSPASELASW